MGTEHWKVKNISEVFKVVNGGTPSTSKKEYWENGDIPWINSGVLKDKIIEEPSHFITKLGLDNSSTKLMPENTVVIALTGATTGKVGILGFRCSANQSVTGLLPTGQYLPRLLFYYLISIRDFILGQSIGSAQPHINKEIVENIPLLIPPLKEQTMMLEKLDNVLPRFRAIKTRLQNVPQLIKKFRQSVVSAACRGHLLDSPGNYVENEYQRIKLSDVVESIKYGTSAKCCKEPIGVPILRIPNVKSGYVDASDLKFAELSDDEKANLKLSEGDLLLVRSNGSVDLVGRTALVRSTDVQFGYAGYLMRLRLNKELVCPDFLNFCFQSYDMRLQIQLPARSTTGVHNINSKEVMNLELSLPPLNEQHKIVRIITNLFAKADVIESRYLKAMPLLDRIERSILSKAFKGEF